MPRRGSRTFSQRISYMFLFLFLMVSSIGWLWSGKGFPMFDHLPDGIVSAISVSSADMNSAGMPDVLIRHVFKYDNLTRHNIVHET